MNKKILSTFILAFFVLCVTGTANLVAESTGDKGDGVDQSVAGVTIGSNAVGWSPKVDYRQMVLTVSTPDGFVFKKLFKSSDSLSLDMSDNNGHFPDGVYTYELLVVPNVDKKNPHSADRNANLLPAKSTSQTGYFSVHRGKFVTASAPAEDLSRPKDILHYDDVIITGSLCVGFDCADGESFGFDTIILKEHNLRIYFNDTSYTASYPTNAWRITINDSTNGGASYFSIDDVDDGTSIFKVEAGAPSNSLYVEDYGRVGLGTSTPVVELHIKDSDTPTVRLEQDSSGGWTAQTFDVAGNESNFFIRDATNGSKLPFRIQPSTPSSTLCLKSDGNVGIGTWSPGQDLEVEKTNEDVIILCDRTDGASAQIAAKTNKTMLGSRTDHQLNFTVNNAPQMTIDTTGYVGIGDTSPSYPIEVATANNARLETSGNWVNPSSRALKENIRALSAGEAVEALNELAPVKFNYKVDNSDNYLGFIAEDVPDLVAVKGRDGMITMDVVAVLTKVLQEQQKTIGELKKEIAELKKK